MFECAYVCFSFEILKIYLKCFQERQNIYIKIFWWSLARNIKNTSIPFSTYAIKSQRNIWIHFVGWKGKLKGFTSKTHPSHFCYIYLSSSSDQFLSCKYLCNPRLSTCFQFAIFLVSLHLLLPGIIRFVAEAWAVIFIQIGFWSQRTSTTKPSFNLDWISSLH